MNLLKTFSFIVGLAVLLVTPFVLLPEAQDSPFAGEASVLIACVGILIFASAYFFFSVAGARALRSSALRIIGLLLVLFQFGAGGWMVYLYRDPAVLASIGPLVSFSLFLLITSVWPSARPRSYRPLRRHAETDHALPVEPLA